MKLQARPDPVEVACGGLSNGRLRNQPANRVRNRKSRTEPKKMNVKSVIGVAAFVSSGVFTALVDVFYIKM
jgi:hypothetical protein